MTDSTERMRSHRARKAREGKRAIYAIIDGQLYERLQRFAAKAKLSLSTAVGQLITKGLKRD